MKKEQKKWKSAIIMSAVILFLDVIVLFLGALKPAFIAWSVGSVGLITFTGNLLLVNYLSNSPTLDKGEVRKAMAGSFIAVYFALISLLTFAEIRPADAELAKIIIGHFTYLVGIIIVFYFGSRAVTEYLKVKEELKKLK